MIKQRRQVLIPTALTVIISLALIAVPARIPVNAQTAAAAQPAPTLAAVKAHKKLRVAFYQGPGASPDAKKGSALTAFLKDPNLSIRTVSPDDIREGKLADYDVLVQPGGSGGGQGKALGEEGRERIRTFVRGGGGYIGICGGSYLATCDYPWSLGILNAKVIDKKHWARGHGPVTVSFSPQGSRELGAEGKDLSIIYWQGPLLAPAGDAKLPAYEPWAKFESEIARNGAPKGVMAGTTAIAAAPYGTGRVICFSPHPEKTQGQESLLHYAVLWVTRNTSAGLPPSPTK